MLGKKSLKGCLSGLWVSCLIVLSHSAFAQEGEIQNRAYLGSIRGTVEMNGKAVTSVTEVFEGARIFTGADSGCILLIGKDQAVQIGALTRAILTRRGTSRLAVTLDLLEGQSRVLVRTPEGASTTGSGATSPAQPAVPVRTKFFLRSRAAVMGVRGTEILAITPQNPSAPPLFATIAGQAELRMGSGIGAPILLSAGQAVEASSAPNAPPPQVRSVSTAQVQQWVSDAGGKAPEIKNRDDFQKKFARIDNLPSGPGGKGPGPSDGVLPPPPPPGVRPDPVLEGRVGANFKVNTRKVGP